MQKFVARREHTESVKKSVHRDTFLIKRSLYMIKDWARKDKQSRQMNTNRSISGASRARGAAIEQRRKV